MGGNSGVIIPITNTILGNERAVGLYEMDEPSPKGGVPHRYQIIRVIRDGNYAEFRKDMGLAKNFKGVRQLNIPSLMEHTVDELIAMAEELRNRDELDLKDLLQLDKFNVK
ncbi:hypothetical protein LCGC14_2356840 [marine sediment metagenome]|uniref:Uncharacterized protein n=1 Tax=marine sediment metagenome TaxID=412755 RepID=A0A0F9F2N8_9ZZZZ